MATPADVIRVATPEIGYRESGTNNTKYNKWLGTIEGSYSYEWCASFAAWVYSKAGINAGGYPRTASCLNGVSWYRNKKRWGSTPHVGDQVFYGSNGGTHTEIVIAVSSKTITTIGGNTSGSLNGQYFAGNGVYKKTVNRNDSRIYGYGTPLYEEDDFEMDAKEKLAFANQIADRVWKQDNVIPSPPWIAEDGNAYWAGWSYITWLYRNQAKQTATLDALTQSVAAVAAAVANGDPVDADALLQKITEAIESVTVRLEVPGKEGE